MYVGRKMMINCQTQDLYTDPKYRQYKWYGYLNRMRCDDRLVNELKVRFESDQGNSQEIKINVQKKHRQKRKKQNRLHRATKKLGSNRPQNLREKRHQRKENRIRGKISQLELKLGIRGGIQLNCKPLDPVFQVAVTEIKERDQLISRMDQEIATIEASIPAQKQLIWSIRKEICKLRGNPDPHGSEYPLRDQPCEQPRGKPVEPETPILIMGDWSISKQLRGMISTPNSRLRRMLARHFPLYLIDEFRTSCLHYSSEVECSNLSVRDAQGKDRKIHAVLTYQTETKESGCINRDNNGCRNMRKLTRSYLAGRGRPERYRRGVEL
jgi:hypothetical protein